MENTTQHIQYGEGIHCPITNNSPVFKGTPACHYAVITNSIPDRKVPCCFMAAYEVIYANQQQYYDPRVKDGGQGGLTRPVDTRFLWNGFTPPL